MYVKNFVKEHDYISFFYIEGSKDPDTLEYSLRLDKLVHLETNRFVSEMMVNAFRPKREAEQLDDAVKSFKEERGISKSVQIGIKASYKYKLTDLDINGVDLASIYADFEKALIGLGFIEASIKDKPTRMIYGAQVGII